MSLPKYFAEDRQHYYDSDIKQGWLVLPHVYKIQEGQRLVLTKGFDNLIYLYSESEFLRLMDLFTELISEVGGCEKNRKEMKYVMRFFSGHAVETEVKVRENAIFIPKILRDYMMGEKKRRRIQIFQSAQVPYTWLAFGTVPEK